MKISLSILITASVIATAFSLTAQAATIDLNTWSQEGVGWQS